MTENVLSALDKELDRIANLEGTLDGYSIYLPPFLKEQLFPDVDAYRNLPIVVNKYIPVIHTDEGYNTDIFIISEHHGPEAHRWAHIAELSGPYQEATPRPTPTCANWTGGLSNTYSGAKLSE